MMKSKLKGSMRSAPERFKFTVQESLSEAFAEPTKHKRISGGLRTVIATVIIMALIPSAVFGASKLYQLIAKTEDKHGLSIDIDRDNLSDYPEYVKMHVKTPEGFSVMTPEPGSMKFYSVSADERFTDGFSLYPMRFRGFKEMKEYIGNVNSYNERVINGNQAYEVRMDQGWDRLYIYYEDVNVFLLIYHHNVTDEQLIGFVNGITFTEGTAEDFTYLDEPSDDRPDERMYRDQKEDFIELPRDTGLTFDYSEHEGYVYTAQITGTRIIDNISDLDESDFSEAFLKNKIADKSGDLLPKTTNTIKEGDGFESVDELLSSEKAEQRLILADICFENLSDKEIELYLPYRLLTLDKGDDGTLTRSEISDKEQRIHTIGLCDAEVVYLEPHSEGKSFLSNTVPAHGRLTVTAGFRCNSDMLDKAYLYLIDGNDFITKPENNMNGTPSYCFKVLTDDR